MDAEIIAQALDGRKAGDGWTALCPAHDDHKPSLSIKDADDGKVLVYCHAGCDQESVIAELRTRGLWPERSANASAQKSEKRKPIIPVPADAPSLKFRHPKYGAPTGSWAYHQADGRLVGYAVRFEFATDGKPDKTVLPITYCEVDNGKRKYQAWRSCGIPDPRPLYRLPQLRAEPAKPVIVTEGEKKADRAVEMFPDYAATTTMGGAKSPRKSNFKPLGGRQVIIWTDNDDPGREYATEVAELSLAAGAASVAIIQIPESFPVKWDLADPPPQGVTVDDLHRLLDKAIPYTTRPEAEETSVRLPPGYVMTKRGLVWRDPSDDDKPEILLAEKFEVVAETRDDEGMSWGVLIGWSDHDGRPHEFALPRAALAGDATEARKVLLDGGLYVTPSRKGRDLLTAFLASVRSSNRARATRRVGWHGGAFVLPNRCFGCTPGDRLLLQGTGAVDHAFKERGTLEEWKQQVARYARGNSRLLLATSVAFAAPLVELCSAESGGLHFKGPSSTGKTTTLRVAASVWGSGETGGYVRSWRATANGLEGVALGHCDSLLCLDELAQLNAREAGEVAYMLANGSGKSRASRDGAARPPARWRTLFLSSGEIGLADKVAEDGRGRRPTAGQQVRIVDVPADANAGLGIYEELHGFPSAEALSHHLKSASETFFGTAAPAFLERVVVEVDNVKQAVGQYMQAFIKQHVPAGADGQVQRVAQRFGLIAAAGEIATVYGIVPWQGGEATSAAARCFNDWLNARGGIEAAEVRDAIEQVRAFISADGLARFFAAWEKEDVDEDEEGRDQERRLPPVRDLAGFRRQSGDGWDYYVTTSAWRSEACRGFDAKATAAAFAERGLLISPEKGAHRSTYMSVPGYGKMRLYHLSGRLLEGDPND